MNLNIITQSNLSELKESFFDNQFEHYQEIGKEKCSKNKEKVKTEIQSFLSPDGTIDATKLKEKLFPQINADVFISHSGSDKEFAIAFAGWLYETFKLTAFIDSCVWEHYENILKVIEEEEKEKKITYDGDLISRHLHIMLSVALAQMIDNTDWLFFLNTPNSITSKSTAEKTDSPWIYFEVMITSLIKKKSESLQKKEMNENAHIQHELLMDHLEEIELKDLKEENIVKEIKKRKKEKEEAKAKEKEQVGEDTKKIERMKEIMYKPRHL